MFTGSRKKSPSRRWPWRGPWRSSPDDHRHAELHARCTEARLQLAEQDRAAARGANERRPDAVGPLDIRILEQRREIARLRAEIWEAPTFLAEPMEVLQMQIDQLADQMQDVLATVETAPALDRR